MRLPRTFFEQKTLKVAKQLLGCFLIRQIGKKKIISRIIETEAYCGPKDLANHASKGRTQRTSTMFKKAGHAYVYLIYGMYHCFNIVTEKEDYPAAVLIRGCELKSIKNKVLSIKKIEKRTIHNTKYLIPNTKLNGPGKLCRALKIDRTLNGVDLCKSSRIWVEDSTEKPPRIKRGKRVGVDYAGKWKDKLWRFYV